MLLPTLVERKEIPKKEASSGIAVVGRDFLSTGLLVDGITHGLKFDAVAVQSADLIPILETGKFGLVIISASLSSRSENGFDLARKVSCVCPDTHILILLDHPSQEAVIKAFQSGARGVFTQQGSMSDFLHCVEHVQKGFIWAGNEESTILLGVLKCIPAQGMLTESEAVALTGRELQVALCAARGQTNKAIAKQLRLSEHTVKNYLFHAFEKLGVSSRIELLFQLTVRGQSFGPAGPDTQNAAEPEIA